jgi:hypothetical protein
MYVLDQRKWKLATSSVQTSLRFFDKYTALEQSSFIALSRHSLYQSDTRTLVHCNNETVRYYHITKFKFNKKDDLVWHTGTDQTSTLNVSCTEVFPSNETVLDIDCSMHYKTPVRFHNKSKKRDRSGETKIKTQNDVTHQFLTLWYQYH